MLYGIDIFSGAGGLSIGAEMAGVRIMFALEKDKHAAETYRCNHKNTLVICDDIHKVDPLQHATPIGVNDQLIIFGGPPCQGFSTSNTVTRNMQNPNNSLFEEFVRFVAALNPDWFLFENVEGFYRFENGTIRDKVKSCFEELGYTISDKVMVASDYGVPQHRKRFIMIGNRHGIHYQFPQKSKKTFTVQDALIDLPNLENGQMDESLPYKCPANKAGEYAQLMRRGCRTSMQNFVSKNADYVIERYKYIGQGQNWKAIPESMMTNYKNKNQCHSGIYKRLQADKPSVVISNYRKNMLIHPYQDRGLSVREAARLQSFPDNFIFKGSLSHIQQQIGNAVPPLLAKTVFQQIIKQTDEHEQR